MILVSLCANDRLTIPIPLLRILKQSQKDYGKRAAERYGRAFIILTCMIKIKKASTKSGEEGKSKSSVQQLASCHRKLYHDTRLTGSPLKPSDSALTKEMFALCFTIR